MTSTPDGAGGARAAVLARIRAARGASVVVEPARTYRTVGEHPAGSAELVDLLEDRLVDYRATVRRCSTDGVRDAVLAALTEAGVVAGSGRPADAAVRRAGVLVPTGLPTGWAPDGHADDGVLTARELDGFAAVVTACRAACAETGTIVLDGEPDQGRRAITLVPDVHVCVVRADQVVQTVPELLARLEPTRPLTLISGPSATSDIELDRVEGVHGPRTLSVVLVTH